MMHNSFPWKAELNRYIHDFKKISNVSFEEDSDENGFILEKALFYSAIITRLLLDDGKVTDRIKGINIPVGALPALPRAQEDTSPIIRKFIDDRLYDFGNEGQLTKSGREIANQIIHSFVIVSFEFSESGCPVGFFVSSDYKSANELYRVRLSDWISFLEEVRDDEIAETKYWRDPETGKWKIARH